MSLDNSTTKKKVYLVHILAVLLILSTVCTAILLFLHIINSWFFIVATIVFFFQTVGSILCIYECKKTEEYSKLYLEGNGKESLSLILHHFTPSTELLLQDYQKIEPQSIQEEANTRKAQYLALQNQINPHFLYNTLEAIRSEAVIGGLDTVADMSETLANFFRYIISNTSELVTLADEIKNVQNYFTIQKFRFGDRINLEISIPPDEPVQFYRLPKLILQPIVENAIIHGLEDKISGGLISISVRTTQSNFTIIIEDNGKGIKYTKLIEINRHLGVHPLADKHTDKHSGIAIFNVNERLQLLYGQKYGLTYFSVPQVGTTVEISLPNIQEEKS